MSISAKNSIQLIGNNIEDVKIISAYCQDSVVTVRDIVFLKKNKKFVIIVNRFMWENYDNNTFKEHKRIRSAIKFEQVLKVKSKKINQKKKNKLLEVLAIECNYSLNKNYKINFFFSGGGIITLVAEFIEVTMNDLGNSWSVKHFPEHKI